MASQFYSYPPGFATSVNPSVGTNGLPAPTSSTEIAGENPSGNLQPLQTDSSGNLLVAATATIPGTVTVVQPTGTNLHAVIDSGSIAATQSGTWNINNISGAISLPTGAATAALQTQISGQLPTTLGQKVMASSLAVVLASDQSAIPVSQSGVWTTARSWTLSSGTDSISAVQSGTWTTARSWTLSSATDSITITGTATVSGTVAATQSGTWNINNISGTISLPTGAATESTLSTLSGKIANDYGVSTGAVRTASQIGNTTGAANFNAGATGAQTLRVSANIMRDGNALSYNTGAADASTLRVVAANESNPKSGRSVVTTVRNDYTSTSVTTGAWVQLVASLGATVNMIEIFDSSGQTMEIGTGAAASETRLILQFPGGNGQVPVQIASGTRVSIRAVSATASVGELDINFYG